MNLKARHTVGAGLVINHDPDAAFILSPLGGNAYGLQIVSGDCRATLTVTLSRAQVRQLRDALKVRPAPKPRPCTCTDGACVHLHQGEPPPF